MFPELGYWLPIKDGDERAFALYQRHYSYKRYTDGRRQRYGYPNRFLIVGPGEKMLLLEASGHALMVWRRFRDDSGQQGVNCAVFRNESRWRSSALLREAMELAWRRWPGQRLYTYVDPRAVRSANAGYCFKCAGWRACGTTKVRKLTILECKAPLQGEI
jgi:hypothetical protein